MFNANPTSQEILINALQVTHCTIGDSYEFILDYELKVLECVKMESPIRGIIKPLKNFTQILDGLLFELNHVRVNPNLDNQIIIKTLTDALATVGVSVSNTPASQSMASCYKPLGEISDNVRFYLNKDRNLVFLSPSMRPRLILCNKS